MHADAPCIKHSVNLRIGCLKEGGFPLFQTDNELWVCTKTQLCQPTLTESIKAYIELEMRSSSIVETYFSSPIKAAQFSNASSHAYPSRKAHRGLRHGCIVGDPPQASCWRPIHQAPVQVVHHFQCPPGAGLSSPSCWRQHTAGEG